MACHACRVCRVIMFYFGASVCRRSAYILVRPNSIVSVFTTLQKDIVSPSALSKEPIRSQTCVEIVAR